MRRNIVAIFSSLLSALAAGVGVGWLVRSMWVRVENSIVGKITKVSEA
jgi:hypothetical protein